MLALEPAGEGLWIGPAASGKRRYRLCAHYATAGICNWAVPADDPNPLCQSCRLSRVIPDLEQEQNHEAWRRLEAAKRRLLYSILNLRLPLITRQEDPQSGLAFEFLADTSPEEPVLTGHDSGVITINIAEADDAERERRRRAMHEPYRTLLGHLRHESGHYYWDLIIQNDERIADFRALFGDERVDYADALQKHYETGPRADWQTQFISAYASTHPWEDWAETWAHYLHMTDALETAAADGISIAGMSLATTRFDGAALRNLSFDELFVQWLPLAAALNDLNRSLGLPDGYPFVLSDTAIAKLRFAHDLVRQAGPAAEFQSGKAVAV